jgi:hypothetical protein
MKFAGFAPGIMASAGSAIKAVNTNPRRARLLCKSHHRQHQPDNKFFSMAEAAKVRHGAGLRRAL